MEEENGGQGREGRRLSAGGKREREERKEHRLFQPHAVERGREGAQKEEEMEGGGTQQHIVVSKARRGKERRVMLVSWCCAAFLPPSLRRGTGTGG